MFYFKKLIILFLFMVLSLNAKENIYLDKKDLYNYDYRIFVGLNTSISYIRSNVSLDKSMLSYGAHIGMPIFWGNELIFKNTINNTSNFKINQKSLILNIPFSSRSSRQAYFGVEYGEGEFKWNYGDMIGHNLKKRIIKDTFYGIHIGKRYKFTRNYYVRIELDAIKYNYKSESLQEDIDTNFSLGFNYGFEYRF